MMCLAKTQDFLSLSVYLGSGKVLICLRKLQLTPFSQRTQANAEKQVLDDSKGEQIAELQDALAQANAAKQELGRLLKRSHTSQGFCNQVELAFLNMLAASASPVGTLSNENVHEWVSTTQENVRRVTGIIHKWNLLSK